LSSAEEKKSIKSAERQRGEGLESIPLCFHATVYWGFFYGEIYRGKLQIMPS
jgi:hypothetical protein